MTDEQLYREVEEDLRRERMQALAKQYGGPALIILAVVMLATAAYLFWQDRTERAVAEQTARYAAITSALLTDGASVEEADSLAAFAAGQGGKLATLARFREAAARAELGDFDTAIAIYDGLAASETDALYRDLAVYLSVQQSLQRGDSDYDALDQRLVGLDRPGAAWQRLAVELRGAIALQDNRTEDARRLFARLLDDPETPMTMRQRLGPVLDFLGGPPAP